MLFVCLFVCLFLCDVACVLYVDQDRNTVTIMGHCCLFVVFMLFVVVSILLEELVYFNSNVCVTAMRP